MCQLAHTWITNIAFVGDSAAACPQSGQVQVSHSLAMPGAPRFLPLVGQKSRS